MKKNGGATNTSTGEAGEGKCMGGFVTIGPPPFVPIRVGSTAREHRSHRAQTDYPDPTKIGMQILDVKAEYTSHTVPKAI